MIDYIRECLSRLDVGQAYAVTREALYNNPNLLDLRRLTELEAADHILEGVVGGAYFTYDYREIRQTLTFYRHKELDAGYHWVNSDRRYLYNQIAGIYYRNEVPYDKGEELANRRDRIHRLL